jgi:hypothetical protein
MCGVFFFFYYFFYSRVKKRKQTPFACVQKKWREKKRSGAGSASSLSPEARPAWSVSPLGQLLAQASNRGGGGGGGRSLLGGGLCLLEREEEGAKGGPAVVDELADQLPGLFHARAAGEVIEEDEVLVDDVVPHHHQLLPIDSRWPVRSTYQEYFYSS